MEPSAVASLAARAGLEPPAASTGAGARLLLGVAGQGLAAVPRTPAEIWAAWVDLGLWRLPRGAAEVGDLTELALADLVAVAERLSPAGEPPPRERALSSEDDARLRTLSVLRQLGELAPELRALERELRGKDQRLTVRPPAPVAWPH